MNAISEEKMQELWHFLKDGKLPEGVHTENLQLTPKQAMSIVWFLQEIAEVLPSNWERCEECDCLYDSDNEGGYVDDDQLADMQSDGYTMLPDGMNKWLCDNHYHGYMREYPAYQQAASRAQQPEPGKGGETS